MSRGGRGPEAIRSSGFNSSARVNAVVISVLIGSKYRFNDVQARH